MNVKRPRSDRKSYALIDAHGKTVKDPRLDAINADLRAGVAPDILEARVRALLDTYRPKRTPISLANERIVEACHEHKLAVKPDLVDPDGLKQRLHRAAEALGAISVAEADERALYRALQHIKSPSQRYEIRRGVNELLLFLKRGFKLANPVPQRPDEVVFIRAAEFIAKARDLQPHYRATLGALFATGCRWAELPVAVVADGASRVSKQLKPGNVLALTKNKKARTAPIIPGLSQYLDEYLKLDKSTRYALCLSNHKRVYYACKKVLGIRIHDLRHSYAVEWGSVGASTAEIARYIGDTESVAERHYRNYCATPDEIKRALDRWTKKA